MISFFYGTGGAGDIRGKQTADYLGGKKNPKEGFENDICIYVKKVLHDKILSIHKEVANHGLISDEGVLGSNGI